MTVEDIKNILENEPLIKELKLDCRFPVQIKHNWPIIDKILINSSKIILNRQELIYLIKNKNNLENLHIFCPICGKKNLFVSNTIGYRKYCSLKCAYKSSERSNNCVKTKRNNIDENGLNSYQRAALKCKNNVDKNGLNCYQRAAKKAVKTKLLDIDENGLNCFQRARKKQIKYQLSDIDKNGLNGLQRVGIKANLKRLLDVNKNGLNGHQRAVLKCKQTKKEKYGDSNYNNKEKCKQTKLNNIDNNGLNGFKRASLHTKEKLQKTKGVNNVSQIHILNFKDINKEFFETNFINDNTFDIDKCIKYFNISKGFAIKKAKEFNIIDLNYHSKSQKSLYMFIKNIYKGEILYNTRKIIPPLELDIYIPEKKLAIEFNGVYWHSIEKQTDKFYHQDKSLKCLNKGIKLIHIYDYEWNKERKNIENLIKQNLYKNKIQNKYNIKTKENENIIMIQIFINNIIIQTMTFKKLKTNEYEIISNIFENNNYIDYTYQILTFFKANYNPSIISCFVDFDKSNGDNYKNFGFKIIEISDPNIFKPREDLTLYNSGKLKLIYISSTTI